MSVPLFHQFDAQKENLLCIPVQHVTESINRIFLEVYSFASHWECDEIKVQVHSEQA